MQNPNTGRRPFPFQLIGAILCGVTVIALTAFFASSWLQLPVSNQELLANYAKANDFWQGWAAVQGIPWWSPNFLQGTSLAFAWSQIFTHIFMGVSGWLGGPFIGPKVAALFAWFLAALTTYGFVARLTRSSLTGALAGFFFFFSASMIARLGLVEHFIVVLSMAFLPLAFWGVMEFIRNPQLRTTATAALGLSLLALTYSKTLVMAAPVIGLFALYEYFKLPHYQRPPRRLTSPLLLLVIGLMILPNLPAIRESLFVAFFDFAPFKGWQMAFSTKTALSWLDRDSLLTFGMPPAFSPPTANPGTYLGIVSLITFTIFLALFPRGRFSGDRSNYCRVFIGLSLVLFWLSFGPGGVLKGQLTFLALANNAPDFAITLSWMMLIVPTLVIFQLIPVDLPGRNWVAGSLIAVYLIVPGFRILELFPFFTNIRAPFDFIQVTGAFTFAVAAALCFTELLDLPKIRHWKIAAISAAVLIQVADVWPYTAALRQEKMPGEVFADFLSAQDFLKKSPKNGSVYPVSGRYFYLLTPMLSGRKLTQEAFQSYLQQKEVAALSSVSTLSKETLVGLWKATGVSWVLIDKSDPDTSVDYQKFLRTCWPVAYENSNFALLSPETPTGAPYLAEAYVQMASSNDKDLVSALDFAKHDVVSIPKIPGENREAAAEFLPISQVSTLSQGYRDLTVPPTGKPGWIVVSQAWHPDWTLYRNSQPEKPIKAYGSLLAAWSDGSSGLVFRFEPPRWYSLVLLLSGIAWIAALGILLFARRTDSRSETPSAPLPPLKENLRALVLIPTYREAETIEETLNKTLSADPRLEILVVDDQSPDGTAKLIEAHSEFGRRIHLLSRAGKQGLGSAYREGFKWGLAKGFDVLVEMDADLSHNPQDIPRLIAALETGAAVAIGSRYLDGIRVDNWTAHRLMLSKWASLYTRMLTGMPLSDSTSGFKAIRRECFDSFNWSTLKAEGYAFQIELHYQFWRMGLPMEEVPITFTDRKAGETKMNSAIAIEAARRVLRLSTHGS